MQTPNVRNYHLPDWRKAILIGLDIALLTSLPILVASWFYNPVKLDWGPLYFSARWGARPILAPVLLLAARLAWRRHLRRRSANARGPADSPLYKKTCLALLIPFIVLLAIEFAARLAGVKTSTYAPIVITGEERLDTSTDAANRIVKDPELLFAFNPGIKWDGYRINSHGFRTWEFSAEKPDGTIRLIALGDSCTAQGHPPYSDRLNTLLQQSPPSDKKWEAFNMGVYGYSLMQGYRQFLKYGKKFRPDIVTIYFGWNDHWLYDKPDDLRMAVRMNRVAAKTLEALHKKRFYAWLVSLARRPAVSADNKTFRVPPDRYALTLEELIEVIRAIGATPLVITAPRRSMHETLVRTGFARSTREAEQMHDRYVDITRSVTRETGTELLDLATLFAGSEYDALFSKDGIHFTEEGLQGIAETIHKKLREMAAEGKLARL